MVKRTFIALSFNIPEKLKKDIEAIKKDLKGIYAKWVEMHNLHLTLAFLGDTNEEQTDWIRCGLRNVVIMYPKFNLRLYKAGAFKSLTNPQIIWIGIEENKTLNDLHNSIRNLAENTGFISDYRAFKPHLTIGRVKRFDKDNNLKEVVMNHAAKIDEAVVSNAVVFYESILTSAGPIYRPIETCNFL